MPGAVIGALDESALLSSHARYVSGLLFAIGLAYWTTLPHIERKAERFRLLTALVAIGGLCRLAGVVAGDTLSTITAAALAMELMVTPALCLLAKPLRPASLTDTTRIFFEPPRQKRVDPRDDSAGAEALGSPDRRRRP